MIYLLLVLSVLSGIGLGYYFGKQQKLAKRLLIISAGFLLSMTVLEIFPEVFESNTHAIGIWILGGVILQLILESLTKGFEHGHFHHQEDKKQIFPIALIVGMFIHAFIEGIPLSKMPQEISPYLQGILVHNIPISFVMGAFLLNDNSNRKIAWIVIGLFALASPLGMLLGHYFTAASQTYILAIVSGIFLHISSVIIFEGNKNHTLDIEKIILVLLGISVAYIGHLFHHH
ncbi:ZIP family metal transporter [Elizabethkingia argentiflava]|uniref:ZIP family metal transporter n=1 Tax=Elizabethkingia argenteiflava TaxID=2681556 RepID=A0A845PUE8_9FLAO|nr:ZIP family metal transporter [Elizabethkingia argenteiflava]NAW51852.1 ZIP family metal transporter [Elizabethkingia argenteiflava]